MNEKIMFIGDPNPSHAIDTFFHGICEVFGEENVFEFPPEIKYHSNYTYDPYNFWTVKNTKKCHLEGHIRGYQFYVDAFNDPNSGFKYICCVNRPYIDSFYATRRYPSLYTLVQLLNDIKPERFKDIAVIFMEEEGDPYLYGHNEIYVKYFQNPTILNPNGSLQKYPSIFEKIDMWLKVDFIRKYVKYPEKVFPLYISAPEDKLLEMVDNNILPFEERKYDVCFISGIHHEDRRKYYNILKSELNVGNNIIFCDRDRSLCGLKEYFNYLNNSKICISIRGGEYSNTRNIEGPYLGCALFTQKLEIEIPNDYIDGHSAIFFDESNLIEKLTEYINDQTKLKYLSENSRNHCLQYHTSKSRVLFYLDKIKNIKNWK
jgi:hypothetical protein